MLQTDKGAWQPADMNPGMRPLAFCAIHPEGCCVPVARVQHRPEQRGPEKGEEEHNDEIYPYSGCTPGSTAGCRSAVQPSETAGTVGDI